MAALFAERLSLTHKPLCGQSLEGARKPPCNKRGCKINGMDKDLTSTPQVFPLEQVRQAPEPLLTTDAIYSMCSSMQMNGRLQGAKYWPHE